MMAALGWLADRGPFVLIAGILAGVLLPALAQILVPYIPHMVAGLLFLAALRIGPARMIAGLHHAPRIIGSIAILQLALPLALLALLGAAGLLGSPFALALILIAAAPPISGSPNMAMMMGFDPAVTMRFLILGTALLPVTVIPVLYFVPALGDLGEVVLSALRLLIVIALSGFAAFCLRWSVLKAPSADTLKAFDGASALLMAIVVIGLMSAVSTALWQMPGVFWQWMGFACLANFGLQSLAYLLNRQPPDTRAALTIAAGNRNIALFLVALPSEVTTPLLVFIGCYQVPMYLTPILTGRALNALGLKSRGAQE